MADLVLYDGICGLCNRLNQFILKRDSRDQFRFSSLQSALAGKLLQRYGRKSDDRDTVYVVANYGAPNECLFAKARAVLFVLGAIGGIWGLTRIVDVLPSPFLDGLYDFVALRRYRWFGHSDTCIAPQPEHRSKFLDDRGSPTA
jgi:predicted DCC family thiol-disulfide oxidoreductase YuxK